MARGVQEECKTKTLERFSGYAGRADSSAATKARKAPSWSRRNSSTRAVLLPANAPLGRSGPWKRPERIHCVALVRQDGSHLVWWPNKK